MVGKGSKTSSNPFQGHQCYGNQWKGIMERPVAILSMIVMMPQRMENNTWRSAGAAVVDEEIFLQSFGEVLQPLVGL
eukprot:scaffold1503_cov150-Ochromonas_danica.AAC.2